MGKKSLRLDEIGNWSEIKLEIVRKYAAAYSRIIANQSFVRGYLYIDGFAGAGTHISERTGDEVTGSPVNAMAITPPFTEPSFHRRWFIDTNYSGESFFVRHAYFTGADEPYEKLKRALRAEIDEGTWSTLYSTRSRPFAPPDQGRIAVKVINHYGDEVLKVFEV